MRYLSYIVMAIAILWAIYGEFTYHFYWEDLILMAMLVAIYLKKGEA